MSETKRVPLKALNTMLATVRQRRDKAKSSFERLDAREAELVVMVSAERDAVKAELAEADASTKKEGK